MDQIEIDLKRYDGKVATLQETKFFGSDVYHVGGSVVLTVGRERPSEGDDKQKGEGMEITLVEPGHSGRHRVQEQFQHACRWEKGKKESCI